MTHSTFRCDPLPRERANKTKGLRSVLDRACGSLTAQELLPAYLSITNQFWRVVCKHEDRWIDMGGR